MSYMAKNTVSTEYTGNYTLPANNNRTYFFIVMTDGTATISFGVVSPGDTTGEIPLALLSHYNPPVAPTGEIRVTTTGTFVIHEG